MPINAFSFDEQAATDAVPHRLSRCTWNAGRPFGLRRAPPSHKTEPAWPTLAGVWRRSCVQKKKNITHTITVTCMPPSCGVRRRARPNVLGAPKRSRVRRKVGRHRHTATSHTSRHQGSRKENEPGEITSSSPQCYAQALTSSSPWRPTWSPYPRRPSSRPS